MYIVPFDPHHTIYAGCDLSSHIDLTSLWIGQENDEGGWNSNWWYWLPETGLGRRVRDDKVPYDIWEEEGYLRTTSGPSINHGQILEQTLELLTTHDVDTIGFDPYNTQWLASQLEMEGVDCVKVSQGPSGISEACKTLEASVRAGTFRHGSNPITNWCAENAAVKRDDSDNLRLIKGASKKRIDGISAAVTGMAIAIELGDRGEVRSVYHEKGALLD